MDHTAAADKADLDFLLYYFSHRAGSIVRIQILNVIFLIGMALSYVAVADFGYSSGNLTTWLIPAMFCLCFVVIVECGPLTIDRFGNQVVWLWHRIGLFTLALRVFNLLHLILEGVGLNPMNGGICLNTSEDWAYGLPVLHVLTDYMEIYLWTQIMFDLPWGLLLVATECATILLRLYSCQHIVRQHFSSLYYPCVFILPYFVIVAATHFYMMLAYRAHMADIEQIQHVSENWKVELETAHRDIKLSLHNIWGSLHKLRTIYRPIVGGNSVVTHDVARNVRSLVLLLDDTTVLKSLKDGVLFPSRRTPVEDLAILLHELIRELEDSSVHAMMLFISLSDVRAKSPILLCGEDIFNNLLSNAIFYAITMMRRRAAQQRAGFKPFFHVCGYSYDIVNKGEKNSMLRLVLDHNGEAATDCKAPDSPSLFSGLEVFTIPGAGEDIAVHNKIDNGKIYSVQTYPVLWVKDVFCVNGNEVLKGKKLSPLYLGTLSEGLRYCGGNLTVEDYYVQSSDPNAQSKRFNRLIIDIPCLDTPKLKSPVRIGRRFSKANSNIALNGEDKEQVRFALMIFDKDLRSEVSSLLLSMGVRADICQSKGGFIAGHEFDMSNISSHHTHVLFDDLAIGSMLKNIKYRGERVFFAPNSIFRESNLDDRNKFERVLPVPFNTQVFKNFVRSASAVTSLPPYTVQLEASQLGSPKKSMVMLVNKCFSNLLLIPIYRWLGPTVKKNLWRLLKVFGRALYWLFLGSMDFGFGKSFKTREKVKFGNYFSFKSVFFGMPMFGMDVERQLMIWKAIDKERGFMSNASLLLTSIWLMIFTSNAHFLIIYREIPPRFYIVAGFTSCLGLLILFDKKLPRNDSVRYWVIVVIHFLGLAGSIYETIIFVGTLHEAGIDSFSIRSHENIHILAFPTMTVLLVYITLIWNMSVLFLCSLVCRAIILVAYVETNSLIQPCILYGLAWTISFFFFASLARLYEFEYFRRISYQALSWQRYRTFFIQSIRNLTASGLRYPLKALLKQRPQLFELIVKEQMKQEKSKRQTDTLEYIRTLNLGFIKLEATESVLSFLSLSDVGSIVEITHESDEIILLKEELSYLAFILEQENANFSTEIHIMIHPNLLRIRFERQLFRMLVVNAIQRSLANGMISATQGVRKRSQYTHYDASISEVRTDIHEIIVQVGSMQVNDRSSQRIDYRIENEGMYKFLSCDCGESPRAVPKNPNNLNYMTIAVADNGIKNDSFGKTVSANKLCEDLVNQGLEGTYESFQLPRSNVFRNVNRFSVPYATVYAGDTPLTDYPYEKRMWLSSTSPGYCGVERPTRRYEHLRSIFSKRASNYSEEMEIRKTHEQGVRKMILVHADIEIGKHHTLAFDMVGWETVVNLSFNELLSNSGLPETDMVLICSSMLELSAETELVPQSELNSRGFCGALMCLRDAGIPPNNPVNNAYCGLDIPILNSTVLYANEFTDRVLLEYIIGANKVV